MANSTQLQEQIEREKDQRPNAESIFLYLPPQLSVNQVISLFSNFTYIINGTPVIVTDKPILDESNLKSFIKKGFLRPNIDTRNGTKTFNHEMLIKVMLILDIIRDHRKDNPRLTYPDSRISLAIRKLSAISRPDSTPVELAYTPDPTRKKEKTRDELIQEIDKLVGDVNTNIFFYPSSPLEVLEANDPTEEDTKDLNDTNNLEQ